MAKPFQHKKSLGQHFLTNTGIAQDIVDAIQLPTDAIVEIGPGLGVLTQFIDKKNKPYYCIDVDDRLATLIPSKFPAVQFIHHDFLTVDFNLFWQNKNISIIGNFPYNISTEIIFKILENKHQVAEVVGMFQKEVAQRFAAKHGNKSYGVTSILAQAYYHITYLFDVADYQFDPPPKVQSGVIRMERIQHPIAIADELFFKQVVKQAFSQRRKTLRNALKPLLHLITITDKQLELRAEQLSVVDFINLANSKIV